MVRLPINNKIWRSFSLFLGPPDAPALNNPEEIQMSVAVEADEATTAEIHVRTILKVHLSESLMLA
jgi:hypothetical protein